MMECMRCQDAMERGLGVPDWAQCTYDLDALTLTVRKEPLGAPVYVHTLRLLVQCLATCQELGVLHNAIEDSHAHFGLLNGMPCLYDFRHGNSDIRLRPKHHPLLPSWCTPDFLAEEVSADEVPALRGFVDVVMLARCLLVMFVTDQVQPEPRGAAQALRERVQAAVGASKAQWREWQSAAALLPPPDDGMGPVTTAYLTRQACSVSYGWSPALRRVYLPAAHHAMVFQCLARGGPYPYYPPLVVPLDRELHGVLGPPPCPVALCSADPGGCATWTLGGQQDRVVLASLVSAHGKSPWAVSLSRDAEWLWLALDQVVALMHAVAATPPSGFCTCPTLDTIFVSRRPSAGGPFLTSCADPEYLMSGPMQALESLPRECVLKALDRSAGTAPIFLRQVFAGWDKQHQALYQILCKNPKLNGDTLTRVVQECRAALGTGAGGVEDTDTYLRRVDVYMFGFVVYLVADEVRKQPPADTVFESTAQQVVDFAIAHMLALNPVERVGLGEAAKALAAIVESRPTGRLAD